MNHTELCWMAVKRAKDVINKGQNDLEAKRQYIEEDFQVLYAK